MAVFGETFLNHHGDEGFVLDQEHAPAVGELCARRPAAAPFASARKQPRQSARCAGSTNCSASPSRIPVERHLTAKLLLDAGADHLQAEAAGRRRRQCAARRARPSAGSDRSALRCQLSSTLPAIEDNAPYLAALVASSCSASARPCARCGSSDTSGPVDHTLSVSPTRYGANSSATSARRSAPCQRESDNSAWARASALMRPSTAAT